MVKKSDQILRGRRAAGDAKPVAEGTPSELPDSRLGAKGAASPEVLPELTSSIFIFSFSFSDWALPMVVKAVSTRKTQILQGSLQSGGPVLCFERYRARC